MIKLNADEFIEQVLKGERDFSNKDLSGLQIKYRGPYGVQKYTHPRFEELCQYLRGVREPINFNGSDLSHAVMEHMPFYGGIHAVSAKIHRAFFQWSEMPSSIFLAANLEEAQLRGSHLEHSNFSGANLKTAVLKGCALEGAIFDYADLTDSDFKESQINGCRFRAAEMKDARMVYAQFDSSTLFYGAKNLDISEGIDWHISRLINSASELEPRQALEALQAIEPNIRTKRERYSFGEALKEVKEKLV